MGGFRNHFQHSGIAWATQFFDKILIPQSASKINRFGEQQKSTLSENRAYN
jgi:hypothetical protein